MTTAQLQTITGGTYTVERIFCVGRNYAAHAREMGKDPERDPPFFFTKWAETLVNADPADKAKIVYPARTTNYHHEVELVVAIGQEGFRLAVDEAEDMIFGYAVGLDMTRRDLQLEAREKGRPWDTGKNVVQSCPVGRLTPFTATGPLTKGAITLDVNGDRRQAADISELIWSVSEVISDLSHYYKLRKGDLIFTGTPAGVGPVEPGNVVSGEIDGLPRLSVEIGEAE